MKKSKETIMKCIYGTLPLTYFSFFPALEVAGYLTSYHNPVSMEIFFFICLSIILLFIAYIYLIFTKTSYIAGSKIAIKITNLSCIACCISFFMGEKKYIISETLYDISILSFFVLFAIFIIPLFFLITITRHYKRNPTVKSFKLFLLTWLWSSSAYILLLGGVSLILGLANRNWAGDPLHPVRDALAPYLLFGGTFILGSVITQKTSNKREAP